MNYFIEISDFKEETAEGLSYRDIVDPDHGARTRICFDWQLTGFGEKPFLVCPVCGKRRVKLYDYDRQYICRQCYPINVYKGIQHTTPGGKDHIAYIMIRYAKKTGIEMKRGPFCYFDYDKPKYKNWDKWADDLKVLQALESMRFQAIFLQRIWSKETIDSILKRTNSYYNMFELGDIQSHPLRLLNWDDGVNLYERLMQKD